MKHIVAELEGVDLDRAVALAEDLEVVVRPWGAATEIQNCDDETTGIDEWDRATRVGWVAYQPSNDWCAGGPIIESERIACNPIRQPVPFPKPDSAPWCAQSCDGPWTAGPTPLIAAMRAYVRSKFGDDVDLP